MTTQEEKKIKQIFTLEAQLKNANDHKKMDERIYSVSDTLTFYLKTEKHDFFVSFALFVSCKL